MRDLSTLKSYYINESILKVVFYMNGTDIAKCLGEISDEIIAQGLTPPVRPKRKRYLRYLSVAAVLVLGIFTGLLVKYDPYGWIWGRNQGFPGQDLGDVYKIVRAEPEPLAPLYLYTVTPDEDVFAAVREEYGPGFDTAIRVFRIDGAADEKQEYYWFPLIKNGEVRLVVYASVTHKGIHLNSTDIFNVFLNTVSNYTSENAPGYIVSNRTSFYCVVGDKAYCTEQFYDHSKYIGEIARPKGELSVVRVN